MRALIRKLLKEALNKVDIEVAANLLKTYYENMGYSDEERLGSSEKKSRMAKMRWAKKRLDNYLGFDIGHRPSHTPEQIEMIKKIEDRARELKNL